MGNISKIIGTELRKASQEEWDERNNPARRPVRHTVWKNGTQKGVRDPKGGALQTPAPKILRSKVDNPVSWGKYLKAYDNEELRDKPWVIMGAGASSLNLQLELLDGCVFYGINWTLEWFRPTFLQIIDDVPYDDQIKNNECWKGQARSTQLVCSRFLEQRRGGNHGNSILTFDIHHPAIKSRAGDAFFAEDHTKPTSWCKNSLCYALNVAAWFKPKKILLVGFDFKGEHFFGDGRVKGSEGHFGLAKHCKDDTLKKLELMRDDVIEHSGAKIIQVGETAIDIFENVLTIKEALDAN